MEYGSLEAGADIQARDDGGLQGADWDGKTKFI